MAPTRVAPCVPPTPAAARTDRVTARRAPMLWLALVALAATAACAPTSADDGPGLDAAPNTIDPDTIDPDTIDPDTIDPDTIDAASPHPDALAVHDGQRPGADAAADGPPTRADASRGEASAGQPSQAPWFTATRHVLASQAARAHQLVTAVVTAGVQPCLGCVVVGGASDAGMGHVPWPAAPVPEAAILPGWQGLQHVWVSLKAPGLSAGPHKVRVDLLPQAGGAPLAPGPTLLKPMWTLLPGDPTVAAYEGVPAVVACPCAAAKGPVRVLVRVLGDAQVLWGEATVQPTWSFTCSNKPQCAGP